MEVHDPTYRSAFQLPAARFVTSFHPAQAGCSLLSDVARMLDPSSSASAPCIQAELYALNVYTAGGRFRSHVDTPRSTRMFGSLVLCLPVPHAGGQLTVRDGGAARVFEWAWGCGQEAGRAGEAGGGEAGASTRSGAEAGGSASGGGGGESGAGGTSSDSGGSGGVSERAAAAAGGSAVQPPAAATSGRAQQLLWAAFFGDYEHDVQPVTAGHRLTLPYHLYRQDGQPVSSLTQQPSATRHQQQQPAPPLDRRSLPELDSTTTTPLIRELRAALADAEWMADGGVLGIKCVHAYAHTSSASMAAACSRAC